MTVRVMVKIPRQGSQKGNLKGSKCFSLHFRLRHKMYFKEVTISGVPGWLSQLGI